MAGEIGVAYTMLKDVTNLIARWKKKNDKDWYINQLEDKLNSLAREYDELNNKYDKLLDYLKNEFEYNNNHKMILKAIVESETIDNKKIWKVLPQTTDLTIALSELIDSQIVMEKLSDFYVVGESELRKKYYINQSKMTEILRLLK